MFFMVPYVLAQNSPAPVADSVLKSTLDDQTNVEVTVYNNNLGLVKDTRKINLPQGEGEIRFMDVAASLMPETVHVKSLSSSKDFKVLEQNYEYDLMDANKLLDKYVGKSIKLLDFNQFQDRKETTDALLLSNNNNEQIYKIGDEIFLGHPGYRVLPEIPENLIAQPTLTWAYRNQASAPQDIEVSYLTNNITWKADYVLVVSADDASSDLSSWVTLDNKSGATYKNAKLKLIAGKVNRAEPPMQSLGLKVVREAMVDSMSVAGFEEKAFFEYHIYDLKRPTTIKDKQTKQISLLEASGIKTKKEFLTSGQNYFYYSNVAGKQKQPVEVFVKFKNAQEDNLGMPLPAGIIRLYKKDSGGSLQFIGEDHIEHTPKDEDVKIKVGEAFDIVAERVQTDFRQMTNRMCESEWEITLRNHKEEDVTVGVLEPLNGNWTIISNSHSFIKQDAFTARFDVVVPKNGEVVVKYRVQTGV
ncbi:MAG: DUF4139 domain-containing protein [Candidatus Omnitrophica bacterium]|nr:DUF4139 domain-containing protein [Candidatus Omnitrophota bacterium]